MSKLRPILGYEPNVRFRCWNAVPLYPILPNSNLNLNELSLAALCSSRSWLVLRLNATWIHNSPPQEAKLLPSNALLSSNSSTINYFCSNKETLAHSAILSVKMEKFRCPYTGCSSAFGTVSGVRKHWQSKHPGEVPTLIAADLLVEQNSLEQREMVSDHSDNDLILMMGLTNNECAIDSRSAGRFARCSELEFQAPVAVTITVSEPNPWKLATGAFFAAIFQEIQSCEVSTKLALSDSGKIFRAVHAANENYR